MMKGVKIVGAVIGLVLVGLAVWVGLNLFTSQSMPKLVLTAGVFQAGQPVGFSVAAGEQALSFGEFKVVELTPEGERELSLVNPEGGRLTDNLSPVSFTRTVPAGASAELEWDSFAFRILENDRLERYAPVGRFKIRLPYTTGSDTYSLEPRWLESETFTIKAD